MFCFLKCNDIISEHNSLNGSGLLLAHDYFNSTYYSSLNHLAFDLRKLKTFLLFNTDLLLRVPIVLNQ